MPHRSSVPFPVVLFWRKARLKAQPVSLPKHPHELSSETMPDLRTSMGYGDSHSRRSVRPKQYEWMLSHFNNDPRSNLGTFRYSAAHSVRPSPLLFFLSLSLLSTPKPLNPLPTNRLCGVQSLPITAN